MPGEENLQSLVQELERLDGEIRNPDVPIDEVVKAASEALSVYRKFKSAYGGATFDVRSVKVSADGKISESPFDWKTLG